MTVVGGVAELIAIRHAESTANAAFAAAEINGLAESGITGRDADVPLSPLGQLQASLLGRWLAALPEDRLPDTAACSPFLRAVQTASIVLPRVRTKVRDMPERPILDPRLRDRETGRLELLTAPAIRQRFPEEVLRRQQAGELDYRPPDGESLMDVAVRVREALRELDSRFPGRRVIVITHDAVVLMLRYIIEELSPEQLGEIIAAGPVRNASVTRWTRDAGRLRLSEFNLVPPDVEALREASPIEDDPLLGRIRPHGWSPDEVIDFEVAIEGLSQVIAIYSARLRKRRDDQRVAAALSADLSRFTRLHRDMRPGDRELVAQVRAECGKIIRDHHRELEQYGPDWPEPKR